MIASLGSINADLILRVRGALTGTVASDGYQLAPGGKAGNVAVMLRRLGARVRLVGNVGSDTNGEVALAGPRAEGVELVDVATTDAPTGFAVVLVEPSGAKTIVRAPGANAVGGAGLDVRAAMERPPRPDVLVADAEIAADVLEGAIAAARRAGVRIVLDPAPPDAVDGTMLAWAAAVTPDHLEAEVLTGIRTDGDDGALAAADKLRSRGAGLAAVKLANGGCAATWSGGRAILRPPAVDVIDTNGAGDAFAGALGWALGCGAGELDAAIAGVAASACAVRGRGAQPPLPDQAALRQMMAKVTVETR